MSRKAAGKEGNGSGKQGGQIVAGVIVDVI